MNMILLVAGGRDREVVLPDGYLTTSSGTPLISVPHLSGMWQLSYRSTAENEESVRFNLDWSVTDVDSGYLIYAGRAEYANGSPCVHSEGRAGERAGLLLRALEAL